MLRADNITAIFSMTALALFDASHVAAACFCLEKPETRQIEHFDCTARKVPNRTSEYVSCRTVPVPNHTAFTRIQDDDGACTPCEGQDPSNPGDQPRNLDAEDATTDTRELDDAVSGEGSSSPDQPNTSDTGTNSAGGARNE